MVVKRIGPISVAKVAAVLYAAIGLLIGGVFSLIALIGGMASDTTNAGAFGALVGVGAIVIAPVLYSCIGFVFALIGATLYNLVAGWVGGVELDVQ